VQKIKSRVKFGQHSWFPCPSLEEARSSSEDACLTAMNLPWWLVCLFHLVGPPCGPPLLMGKKTGLISTNSNSLLSACLKISYPVINITVNRQLTKLIKKNFMINMIKSFRKIKSKYPHTISLVIKLFHPHILTQQ